MSETFQELQNEASGSSAGCPQAKHRRGAREEKERREKTGVEQFNCPVAEGFQKIPALTLHRLFPPGARGKPCSHFALSEAFVSGDGETLLQPRRAAPDKAIG